MMASTSSERAFFPGNSGSMSYTKCAAPDSSIQISKGIFRCTPDDVESRQVPVVKATNNIVDTQLENALQPVHKIRC